MSLIHNEKIKLEAAYLNGLAVASFATGVFVPSITYLNEPTRPYYQLVMILVFFMGVAFLMHRSALSILEKLIDPASPPPPPQRES